MYTVQDKAGCGDTGKVVEVTEPHKPQVQGQKFMLESAVQFSV